MKLLLILVALAVLFGYAHCNPAVPVIYTATFNVTQTYLASQILPVSVLCPEGTVPRTGACQGTNLIPAGYTGSMPFAPVMEVAGRNCTGRFTGFPYTPGWQLAVNVRCRV